MESEHRVAWCVTAPDGAVTGPDGDLPVFARSAVKPLQALGSVRAGVLERFELGDRHLALACASHGGSPDHVAVVAEVLEACGLVEGALGCGPELPRDPRAAEGARPSRIRHNCSGKHAFGLARCLAEGWPLDGYFRAGHALQGAMRDCVAEACGVDGSERGGDRRLRDAHVRRAARPRSPARSAGSPAAASGRPATAAPRRCAPIPSSSPSTARSTPS